uniref:Probable purine permease n=1 Tax=Brassica oleracea var. oleracea TaxID=109376 RepID=A0A0D3C1P1_BRAOL
MLEPEVEFLPRADYFKRLCLCSLQFCCRLLVSVHRCEVALIEALRHRQVPSTVVSCVIILCSHRGVVAMLKIIVGGPSWLQSLIHTEAAVNTRDGDAGEIDKRGLRVKAHFTLDSLDPQRILNAHRASSLISRLYFSNGGKSKWIISWVAVAGWPITSLILLPTYIFSNTKPTPLNAKLLYTLLGFLSAADNLMYAYAYACLPPGIDFLSPGIFLARLLRFVWLSHCQKPHERFCYQLHCDHHRRRVTFQLGVLGATAVLFLASTVMAGVLNAVRGPITSVAAVILMNYPMTRFKILSFVLTFWGFSSYIYGSSSSNSSTQASSSS